MGVLKINREGKSKEGLFGLFDIEYGGYKIAFLSDCGVVSYDTSRSEKWNESNFLVELDVKESVEKSDEELVELAENNDDIILKDKDFEVFSL